MKNQCITSYISLAIILFAGLPGVNVQAQDTEKPPLVVTMSYFSSNNSYQYLTLNAKSKTTGRFQPVSGVEINLYLNKDSSGKGIGTIGKVVTDEKGHAAANIPPALAQLWNSTVAHTFIAVTEKTNEYAGTTTEIEIQKAKLTIDTADDKNVTATLSEFKGNAWVPVKGVDIKLGICRLGGSLQIGDDAAYTTDSLGHVTGEFKKLGIPGDVKGNIVLVAKVEDNDQYGNLRVEKSEPWGTKFIAEKDFFHRALWASRFHSPVWLVVIAYSIIIAVWGTIIYLIFMLIKIKKIGLEEENKNTH